MEERIVALEMKASYMEGALMDMGDIIRAQEARLSELEAAGKHMARQLLELKALLEEAPPHERPPHY